jgi:hypothetical protein
VKGEVLVLMPRACRAEFTPTAGVYGEERLIDQSYHPPNISSYLLTAIEDMLSL